MSLGTIAYKDKIYNLDYMNLEDTKNLLKIVEDNKKTLFKEMKNIAKNIEENN